MEKMKRAHSDHDIMYPTLIEVLADKSIKINQKYVTNQVKNQNTGQESKKSCKILKFSADWSFNDVLTTIDSLKPAEYPHLFIFITHVPQSTDNEIIHEQLKENVLKFGSGRPLIMQLISENENASKIFYKIKASNQFLIIDDHEADLLNFPSFLSALLNGKFKNFDEIIKHLKTIQNSSLILRFLRTLDLSEEFFKTLVLKCAACGSKNDLLAALDAPFEDDGKKLSITSQKYLSTILDDNQSDDEDTDDEAPSTSTQQSSVLLTAIENKNKAVIDCLITLWSNLIQKLPFHYQVKISTTAFETGQFDVLCDLLNTADFPFPEDFRLGNDKSHEKIQKVVAGRTKLISAVTDGDFEKIDDLVREYYNLKFGYNINNNSAMKEALNSNKPAIFYYLKNYGFQADDCEELLQKLSQKEIDRAQRHAAIQKTVNIENCLRNSQQSVLMLSTMSYIHNKKMTKPTETDYRDKIRKWYGAINKVAPEVLDVAVMNDSLKIIYDFESETVENVSLSGPNTSGITYISNKWIFIGAKITNKNREIQIISTIAQQLCYYVLHVVYENGGKPYYKENFNLAEIFENIVKSIDVWSATPSEYSDECLGIISSVFKDYPAKNFHAELILRVIQILTEFSEDQELSSYIQQKYKNLFNFWHDFVVPELSLFLQRNEEIVRLNSYIEVLYRISKLKIELIASKYTPNFDKNNFIIITTNIPTLLLIDIQRYLKNIHGCLLGTKNIFVDPERFENQKIRGDYYQFCKQYPSMNVVVDCSKENFKYLEHVFVNKKNNFIFVAWNEKQRDELVNICLKLCSTNPELLEVNYNWLNLTNKSQKNLLKIKVNFQNNESLMLMDVLDLQSDLNSFSNIFDDQLLNLLLDNQKIEINAKVGDELDAKKFNYKFKPRKFIKKAQDDDDEDMDAENPKISTEDLPKITKNSQYILISDKAGTGKSWAIKNISKVINDKYPTKWVTYVDLKQFTKKYNEKKFKPEFLTFMIDKILMPKTEFEEKIFQKLYKDGRVCIFFDGFDEIAPDHIEFVEKLMASFEFNGGNQMWIGTRDYFEVDLKEKFRINQIFKLDEFLKDFGFDLMLKSWILLDYKRDLNAKNFDEITKNSPKIENYQELVVKIIKKLSIPKNYSIVTPQIYQMIAESFKEETNAELDINRYKILRACGIILYRIWSDGKGEIRREANIRSQEFELNFWKFHQYAALLILFPNLIEEFFQYYDPSEWINEEILACGFMSFKNGKYYFLYGAFQDFFIVELIVKVLKRKKLEGGVLDLIVDILINKTYFGIQIMLNDAIEDDSKILDNHGQNLMKSVDKVYSMDNFEDYFIYELDTLVDVIVKILKNGNYEQKKVLLSKTVDKVIKSVKSTKMYLKFEELLLTFLNSEDLKTLVKNKEVLHRIVGSELSIEVFEGFVTKLEIMYDREYIREIVRTKSSQLNGNILSLTSMSENKEDSRIPRCIKILQKFLTSSEMVELMMDCNQFRETILHVCVQTDDKEILKIMWTEVEKIVDPQTLKSMITKKSEKNNYTILHYAATGTNIEFHKTLWNLLQKCFDNQTELMDLMTQKCLDGCNFLHHLVRTNESDIIEFTFKCLKENFSSDQYNKILIQKNSSDQNLLQNAVKSSNNLQIHQVLWKVFQDSCESNLKFVEFIKKDDKNGNNVLQLATSRDVFEFIVNEFEKIATIDDFRQLLSNSNQNLLQIAAKYNNSVEFHQVIWLTFPKYFSKSDILEFSRNQDANGHNLLFNAVQSNTKEIAEFIWNEIKKLLNKNDQVEYLKHAGNILEAAIQNVKNQEVHEWIKMLIQEYGIVGTDFEMSGYEDAKEEMDCDD